MSNACDVIAALCAKAADVEFASKISAAATTFKLLDLNSKSEEQVSTVQTLCTKASTFHLEKSSSRSKSSNLTPSVPSCTKEEPEDSPSLATWSSGGPAQQHPVAAMDLQEVLSITKSFVTIPNGGRQQQPQQQQQQEQQQQQKQRQVVPQEPLPLPINVITRRASISSTTSSLTDWDHQQEVNHDSGNCEKVLDSIKLDDLLHALRKKVTDSPTKSNLTSEVVVALANVLSSSSPNDNDDDDDDNNIFKSKAPLATRRNSCIGPSTTPNSNNNVDDDDNNIFKSKAHPPATRRNSCIAPSTITMNNAVVKADAVCSRLKSKRRNSTHSTSFVTSLKKHASCSLTTTTTTTTRKERSSRSTSAASSESIHSEVLECLKSLIPPVTKSPRRRSSVHSESPSAVLDTTSKVFHRRSSVCSKSTLTNNSSFGDFSSSQLLQNVPDDDELLLHGWKKAMDVASGQYYYYSLDRSTVVWKNPLLPSREEQQEQEQQQQVQVQQIPTKPPSSPVAKQQKQQVGDGMFTVPDEDYFSNNSFDNIDFSDNDSVNNNSLNNTNNNNNPFMVVYAGSQRKC